MASYDKGVLLDDDDLWQTVKVVNESGVEVDRTQIIDHIRRSPEVAALSEWAMDVQGRSNRQGSIIDRDKYVVPGGVFDQFKAALTAAETDDVVSGVVEATEGLAFSKMVMEAEDPDQRDIWNQLAASLDLDSRLREMWRENFILSQFCVAMYWGNKTYTVRGRSEAGVKRKKRVKVRVPLGMTMLDPFKVVPVGTLFFGRERLAYLADETEQKIIEGTLSGETNDAFIKEIIEGSYELTERDRKMLSDRGAIERHHQGHLYLLKQDNVFRHTETRSQHQPWATVRMKSVFELLDLKTQLRQMDRAHLMGAPLRVDQRIPTPDGWKPIGAARVGDEVFSVDGKTTTIVGVFPQGVLPMYKVTFTDGAEVYCDGSHPWTVLSRTGRERTLKLDEIVAEGLFGPNGPGRRIHRHRVPVAAPLELPPTDLPLDPYLIGYMLGDGSLTQSMPKITCAEPEHDQPWRLALPTGVTVSQFETRTDSCPQYGLKGSRWRLNEVTEGLRDLGLWGVDCVDKYIPEACLWGSVAQRWALLQGLCDSDGHSPEAGGVEYSTISPKLADGVVHLVQSLGGVAKISERPASGARRTCYRVWISLNQREAPFRIERKARRWKPRKHPIVRAFHSVERSLDAEAVCIKTARDDGLFLTEGMVTTHNTNFIVVIKKGSDQQKATNKELQGLRTMARSLARIPMIIGDHRLQIEIVTPKTDNTLKPDRYNGIDSRITARLYQIMALGNFAAGARGDDSLKLARVIARGLESRRHQIKRALERHVWRLVVEKNSEVFDDLPDLRFTPKRIALDFDTSLAQFMLDLADRGDLSRDTLLSEFDFDQEEEARKRTMERESGLDEIFQTAVPFSSPDAQPHSPSREGRNKGGRKNGGGANNDKPED